MHPYLVRSAVALLRRPTPQGSAFLRRSIASGGAPRVEETKGVCMVSVQDFEEIVASLEQVNKQMEFLLEHERRLERSEQRQRKLACVLVPATIAFYIFGPEKKGKPSLEGQSEI
ncbi:uncharacterized protein LOC123401623 [Hordeum vulgare subsp. vulgare]|uniref:Predicted protein n=1 Tax=Hordeum vulgare subsp. vulgare TaxID=112509 RepID=F2D0Q7_HORVV|nr:uncharacterized protein LOC123401623 [Hordeum vulgare subsp. vulgare]BAJ88678.1 predicted protein [Hordeum vulgare subsp. vulgare]